MTARRLRLQETKADGQGGRIRLGSGPLDTVSSKSTGSLFDHSGSLFDHSVGRPSLGLLYLGMSHSLGGSFTSTLALLVLCQCTGSEFTQHNLTELDPRASHPVSPKSYDLILYQPQYLFYSESGCVDLLKIRDITQSVYI